jgi:hypothetical protein
MFESAELKTPYTLTLPAGIQEVLPGIFCG